MKVVVLILAAFTLGACDGFAGSTLPDGVTAADVALFKGAVAQAGCAIETPAQAVPIAAQTGFDQAKLRSITQYLVLAGESEPTATGFRLISGPCANA